MTTTTHTSYRLSGEARRLLAELSEHYGLTRTAVLEWLIRTQARKALQKPTKARR